MLHIINFVKIIFSILNASKPGKTAVSPRASSILNNWLYFAILSDLEAEPVWSVHSFVQRRDQQL